MARGKGFQAIVGHKKASTWGTAVACTASDGIYVTEIGVDGGLELIENNQLTGVATQAPPTAGDHRASVTLKGHLGFDGWGTILAQAMGTAGAPTTVDTTGKQHVLKVKDDLDGLFGTLAYEIVKDTTVHEVTTVKWTGFTLSGKANENVTVEVRGTGHRFLDSSSTNTTSTIDNVTVPTDAGRLATWPFVTLDMNAQTGASLGVVGATPIYVSEFELSVDRSLEGVVTTRFGSYVDEPHPTGFTKVSGKFTFAQLQDGTGGNVAMYQAQLAKTEQKAKLAFTSTTLVGSATQMYQYICWLPRVCFLPADKPKITGPGIVSWSQSFNAYHVTSIPTGFTANYTQALIIDVFNTRSTDYLA